LKLGTRPAFQVIFSSQARAAVAKAAKPSTPASNTNATRLLCTTNVVFHNFTDLLFHFEGAVVKFHSRSGSRREGGLALRFSHRFAPALDQKRALTDKKE